MTQSSLQRVLSALMGALMPLTGSAQLFKSEDTDARRGIVELRARLVEVEQSAQARYAEAMAAASQSGAYARSQMASQFKELLGAEVRQFESTVLGLRRSILELNNQIEAVKAEQARVLGKVEESDRQAVRGQADAQAATAAAVSQTRTQMAAEFKNLLGAEIDQFVTTMSSLRQSFVNVSTALETIRSQQTQILTTQAELQTAVQTLQSRMEAAQTEAVTSAVPAGKPKAPTLEPAGATATQSQ